MTIQHIHVLIILFSILLSISFGVWTLTHTSAVLGFVSFAIAAFLIIYGFNFIRKFWSK